MSVITGWGILVLLLIIGAPVILWIIALVDCLRSNFEKEGKILWILVIVFLPILGSLLYLFIGRGQKLSARDHAIKS
jgi:ABC-type transport system involved in cytochrome c biogenesis permease component